MSNFIDGALSADLLGQIRNGLAKSGERGAEAVFFGSIRADRVSDSAVVGIEYSCHETMANAAIEEIKTSTKKQFGVQDVLIFHSKGFVAVGESSVLVLVSDGHRKAVFAALESVVEQMKFDVPIWKKEHLADGKYRWKEDKRK